MRKRLLVTVAGDQEMGRDVAWDLIPTFVGRRGHRPERHC